VFAPASYVLIVGIASLGAGVMRQARARWPKLSGTSLASICFIFMIMCDIVFEYLGGLRLQFWAYGGGLSSFSADRYYRFPLNALLLSSAFFTGLSALTFFRNDRGQTVAERGVDQLSGTTKTVALRFLAILAATQLTLLVVYHIPAAVLAVNSSSWPKDIQQRSYLTNHVCGPETDRACPGPAVPLSRPGSAYVDPTGTLVVPNRTRLQPPVPFRLRP
jgi:hypothetical protein